MDRSHYELKELVAAYVLGALPEDEAFLARIHILSCDECIAEAESNEDVLASLAVSVDEAVVRRDFADSVVGRVRNDEMAPTGDLSPRPRLGPRVTLRAVVTAVTALLVVGGMTAALLQMSARARRDERILIALLHSDEGAMHLKGEGGAVPGSYRLIRARTSSPRGLVWPPRTAPTSCG